MLHAKYIIYLTRTLSSLNKKNCLLFVFPPSQKESIQCGSNFFCWLRWLNLEICCHFCTDESWLMELHTHFWGQCRSSFVELPNFTVHQYAFLFFFKYRILLMAGFVALFPQLDQGFDPQKKILMYFLP